MHSRHTLTHERQHYQQRQTSQLLVLSVPNQLAYLYQGRAQHDKKTL